MKEKLRVMFEKSKGVLRKIGMVIFIVVTGVAAFSAGFLYRKETAPKVKGIEMVKVNKSEVNLALDENNHLIVIDKKTGNYTVYDDSIGVSIFKIYARNIKLTE